MAEQDAQDINQMMSGTSDVLVSKPKKSKFIWIVLGCVVAGIGLGVVVYQQSVKTVPVVKTTPRPSTRVAVAPTPAPFESPVPAAVEFVTAVANTITFPKAGKLRVFTDINNILLVVKITIAGQTQTLTIPNKKIDATTPMTYADSAFEVAAGSTATIVSTLNVGGPQNMGWIAPNSNNECGANKAAKVSITPQITWTQSHLVAGQTIFAKQCWADPGTKTVIEDNDFNDFVLFWSYGPVTNASPSPSSSAAASGTPTPTPTPTSTPTPSPSRAASATPTPTPTPNASARAAMPDTSGGTPVTGVFEVTVGTVSAGLILLLLGLFGLLAL